VPQDPRYKPGAKHPRREDIAMRLHSIALHLLRRVRKDDPISGLTPARASLISTLVSGGRQTMGQLAAAEQVTPATMSRLVAGLVRDGYAERKWHEGDGRLILVAATQLAEDRLKRARARRVRYVAGLLDRLPVSGWATVEDAVGLLERALH
jgi:DNA-binding MarR family transcriptional regulator